MRAIGLPHMWFRVFVVCAALAIGMVYSAQTTNRTLALNGLKEDDQGSWKLVQAHCTSCHSSILVTQQRLNRSGWERVIRRMQMNENLWDLGTLEPVILDYLTAFYGPNTDATHPRPRRRPLAPTVE